MATALMYHSVRDSHGFTDPTADEVYTVSAGQFAAHLDLIRESGHPVSTVSDLAAVNSDKFPGPVRGQAIVLTFDDGTTSHLEPVLHMLWERNMPGEFFVNPANVGRHGFLSWSELRGMASAGMSIQSHGYSHRYMDDLDDTAVADELLRSKKVIEDRLGQPVAVFAAPGGRVNSFVAALAYRVGYKAVCGSRPGQWHPRSGERIIPRIAIRAATMEDEIRNWIENRPFALAAQAGRYRMLQMARWALGNNVYDNLRQRYLGDH
ncbi:MAG TPA: polysaccharide deacetylase family protein [Gammaproteobacteria bacterium]